MAFYSSLNNYYSLPDHSDFVIPNSDWTMLTLVRADVNVSSGQDIFSTAEWGISQSFNIYLYDGEWGVKVHTLDDSLVNLATIDDWTIVGGVRTGSIFRGVSVKLGTGFVRSGNAESISASYDASQTITIGRRSDDGTNPFKGSIADVIWIPGYALSNKEILDLANGRPVWNQHWSKYIKFHFHPKSATQRVVKDYTGRHIVTASGTTFARGEVEIDPPEFKRFSPVHIFVPDSPIVNESTLTATGTGGTSLAFAATDSGVVSAVGTGAMAADSIVTSTGVLSASGVGAFPVDSTAKLSLALTAAGAGVSDFVLSSALQTTMTADGVGDALFDINTSKAAFNALGAGGFDFDVAIKTASHLTANGMGSFSALAAAQKQSDLTAAGVGAFTGNMTARKLTDMTAVGNGAASFDNRKLTQAKINAAGDGAASFVLEYTAAATLIADGVGGFVAAAQFSAPMEFAAEGIGTASFRGTSFAIPVTIPNSPLYFIAENAFDEGALSVTSTAIGFDVENMRTDIKTEVWRSIDASVQTITTTWTESQLISAVAFAFSNLVNGANVRVRLYTEVSDITPVYDSNDLSIDFSRKPAHGFDTIGLASFSFSSGTYFSKLFATVPAKKQEIIIDNAGNPDGYIEISRIISGLATTPTVGARYGADISAKDSSEKKLTTAGNTLIHRGVVKKSLSFPLGTLDTVSKHGLADVINNRAASSPVFVSMFDNSNNAEERQSFMIYGLFDLPPGVSIAGFNNYTSSISITEI